jgi:glycerate 2-kinase
MRRELAAAISRADGLKKDALCAVDASLRAADPASLVRNAITIDGRLLTVGGTVRDVGAYGRVVVLGGGKASGLMAAEVERILGERLDDGVVIVPEYQLTLPRLQKVKFVTSTHPLPSEVGARAVERMLAVLKGVRAGDLVVVLISGGGSALMPAPPKGVTVRELQSTTEMLLKAGADISEINCVRKHLSQIAGGRLAEKMNGADVLCLVISDVVGDDLSSIASGPTVPDPTTFSDAQGVLRARRVWERVPSSVRRTIEGGVHGYISETPKPGNPIFERVSNVLVGSNSVATSAAKSSLEALGFRVEVASSVTGEAKVVGKRLARLARGRGGRGRWAAVWGGETSVTVRGRGIGGRNQELALAAAIELRGSSGVAVAAFGTDGIDGTTRAAGAFADSTTFGRAKSIGLDPIRFLSDNDSNSFFTALGDLIVTGPTGTNVNDVMLALRA